MSLRRQSLRRQSLRRLLVIKKMCQMLRFFRPRRQAAVYRSGAPSPASEPWIMPGIEQLFCPDEDLKFAFLE